MSLSFNFSLFLGEELDRNWLKVNRGVSGAGWLAGSAELAEFAEVGAAVDRED